MKVWEMCEEVICINVYIAFIDVEFISLPLLRYVCYQLQGLNWWECFNFVSYSRIITYTAMKLLYAWLLIIAWMNENVSGWHVASGCLVMEAKVRP